MTAYGDELVESGEVHETDRGVLMICDPRLTDKPYGRRIWQSLPPMRRTRELQDAVAFFAGARAVEAHVTMNADFAAG